MARHSVLALSTRSTAGLLVALISMRAAPCAAQQTDTTLQVAIRAANRKVYGGPVRREAADPSRTSALTFPQSQVRFSTTSADKRVEGALALVRGDFAGRLGVSGPIGDDASEPVELASLKRLRSGAIASAGVTWTRWDVNGPAAKLQSFCLQDENALPLAPDSLRGKLADSLQLFAKDEGARARAIRAITSDDDWCSSRSFLAVRDSSVIERFVRLAPAPGVLLVTVNGELRSQREKRADPAANYAEQTSLHQSQTVSLGVGWYSVQRRLFTGISWLHEDVVQGGKPVQLCTPLEGTATNCRSIAVTKPKSTRSNSAQLEVRKFINAEFATGLRISYDPDSSTTGFEIPLFKRGEKDESFASGISLGWRTDKREFIVSAFVNQLFAPLVRRP